MKDKSRDEKIDEKIKEVEPIDNWKQFEPEKIKVKSCEHPKLRPDHVTENHHEMDVELCVNCGKVIKILSDKLVL